jgi:hypothetical protein
LFPHSSDDQVESCVFEKRTLGEREVREVVFGYDIGAITNRPEKQSFLVSFYCCYEKDFSGIDVEQAIIEFINLNF